MNKIAASILALFIFILNPIPLVADIEESDLPPEVDTRPIPKSEEIGEPTIVFEGYVNSRDVAVVANVMGCVYYFCRERQEGFCSDQEGVLIITGAETGREPELLKELDIALENQARLLIRLSSEGYYLGIRKIVDINPISGSI